MKYFMAALLVATTLSPIAVASELSKREALQFAMPTALKVLERMEEAQGIKYDDDQIDVVLHTPVFADMFKQAIQQEDKYGFCTGPEKSATCDFKMEQQD